MYNGLLKLHEKHLLHSLIFLVRKESCLSRWIANYLIIHFHRFKIIRGQRIIPIALVIQIR